LEDDRTRTPKVQRRWYASLCDRKSGKIIAAEYTQEEKFMRDQEEKIGQEALAEYRQSFGNIPDRSSASDIPFMFVWLHLENINVIA
jgi:hypothetical protein